jgi:hypothetical protein
MRPPATPRTDGLERPRQRDVRLADRDAHGGDARLAAEHALADGLGDGLDQLEGRALDDLGAE